MLCLKIKIFHVPLRRKNDFSDMNVKKIFLFAVVIAIMFAPLTVAQNNTNSPYTRYGYGALADRSFAAQRAMGGIGFGLRNPQMLNPMNPASFSDIDSLTFMFELGLTGQYGWFEEQGRTVTKLNGNIEYLAMQFPIARNFGIGIGLEPVSYVGYQYGDTARLAVGDELSSNTYSGSGGLNKVYASLSYELFDRLALGVKAAYQYGDVYHQMLFDNSSVSGAYNTIWTDTVRQAGFVFDFGLQYVHPVGKNHSLTLGLVYTPKQEINSTVRKGEYRVSSSTIVGGSSYMTRDSVFEMPEAIGAGFTFNRFNRFTVGGDVLYQRWADAKYYDHTGELNNRIRIGLGGEYIPNMMNNRLYNRIRYRAGASYSNSYVSVKGSEYKEYGFNVGLGIPMVDRRSFLNFALQYSLINPEVKTLLREQYFRLTVSYTFNELWFFKQKLK